MAIRTLEGSSPCSWQADPVEAATSGAPASTALYVTAAAQTVLELDNLGHAPLRLLGAPLLHEPEDLLEARCKEVERREDPAHQLHQARPHQVPHALHVVHHPRDELPRAGVLEAPHGEPEHVLVHLGASQWAVKMKAQPPRKWYVFVPNDRVRIRIAT